MHVHDQLFNKRVCAAAYPTTGPVTSHMFTCSQPVGQEPVAPNRLAIPNTMPPPGGWHRRLLLW